MPLGIRTQEPNGPPPASPLFETAEVSLVRRIPSARLINMWADSFKIDISSELRGNHQISLYLCHESGLGFFLPRDVAASPSLYEQLQRFPWYYSGTKWEYEYCLRYVSELKNIAEIGCGRGTFLKMCASHGINAVGFETNRSAIESVRAAGFIIFDADLSGMTHSTLPQFDAVCAFQVLEHVSTPRVFLSTLVSMLRPSGLLALGVPNSDSYLRLQENLLDLPPHHMTRWNAKSLESLQRLYPLELLTMQAEPLASYHIEDYLSTYAQYTQVARALPWRYVARPLLSRILQLGFRRFVRGHTICAIYRKTGSHS